jgi:secreted trypsin-like serine protease
MRAAVAAVAALAVTFVAGAQAITYGQADGGRHPEVGALVGTFSDGTYPYCSGALISSTVFLTAAHCDIGTSRVSVTFDEQYTSSSKLYSGTFRANPGYGQSQSDPADVAVVVLDHAIRSVTPARLPTAGLLDQMKRAGTLSKSTRFTAVGYGSQEVPNGRPELTYLDARELAVGTFDSLKVGYLQISQNAATGNGGTCYGDSGGPNFLGAGDAETSVIAGTTITGDVWCKSTNVAQRMDVASVRSFLGQFVSLP